MILFVYGEDGFRLLERVRQIKNEFTKNNPEASVIVFDFIENETSVKKLQNSLDEQGLFSNKKLVIAKNFIANSEATEQKYIIDFLQDKKIDNNTQLIFVENKLPRKNNRLFGFLLKETKAEELNKLQGIALQNWIQQKIKEIAPTVTIQNEALNKLIYYVGNDLMRMSVEIEKLVSYTLDKEKQQVEIRAQDIELLVSAKIEANIFETVEAISLGDKRKALDLLHKQLEQGDDPFYIFSMYVYQFRSLLKIADFYFQGNSNQYEIAKLAKLHPYVVQKGLVQLRNFSWMGLKNIYKKLEEMDIKIKTGKLEIKLALDRFVVE